MDRSVDATAGVGPHRLGHTVSVRRDRLLGTQARTSGDAALAFASHNSKQALNRLIGALQLSLSVTHDELTAAIDKARE